MCQDISHKRNIFFKYWKRLSQVILVMINKIPFLDASISIIKDHVHSYFITKATNIRTHYWTITMELFLCIRKFNYSILKILNPIFAYYHWETKNEKMCYKFNRKSKELLYSVPYMTYIFYNIEFTTVIKRISDVW